MHYIGLLDCNNFFVSCERLFRPDLANKPVAVLSSNDGCIVARSPEVKAMGIPMGIPLFKAKQLVDMSQVTLFSSNFTLYRDLSSRVMDTLAEEVGECDIYSIDEAFFTVSATSEAELARLRAIIMQKTGIPVSIGVAATKTLAKEASEIAKKGSGVCLLTAPEWAVRAETTPCSDIWNLGRATTVKLQKLGVETVAEFMRLERRSVRQLFGIAGERIYDELSGVAVYGLDDDPRDTRKSTTSSRSFAEVTHDLPALQSAVAYHVAQVSRKIRSLNLACTVMYIELRASRHSDFSYRKGSTEVVFDVPTESTHELTKLAHGAVARIFDPEIPYKKAGVTVSGLVPKQYLSPSLFDRRSEGMSQLDQVLDAINERFGFAALHSAAIMPSRDRSNRKLRSAAYTTSWADIPTVRA